MRNYKTSGGKKKTGENPENLGLDDELLDRTPTA